MLIRRAIVAGLDRLCALVDELPGQLGCRVGIGRWAATLDDRWGTGHWRTASTL